uniref:Autotransporter domain-containing protein n=1 Tax=Panagrellus redivivus TaxID=6233 RepID=A0A7E4UVR3_PANRE
MWRRDYVGAAVLVVIFGTALMPVLPIHAEIWNVARLRRQTAVSSNANSNGTGSTVENSGSAQNYKTADGVIGVNASAAGNANGNGSAGLNSNAFGSVGNMSAQSTGNSLAQGTNSGASSNINSAISGGNMSVSSNQQAQGSGVGDTAANANGGALLTNGTNMLGSNNTQANAGATGSLSSSSQVIMSQTLTWGSILAQLVGSAVAQGVYNAQANIALGQGTANNGVEVDGLVSGDTSGGGLVNAQANGNANIDNDHHQLSGDMYGNVNGTGNATLVGASNLQSNNSGVNQTMSAFGDGAIVADPGAQSNLNLQSDTNLDNQAAITGNIGMNGSANTGNKNMTVQAGLQTNNGSDGMLAIGNGSISGQGNLNSSNSMVSNVQYQGNNTAAIESSAKGNSASNNGQNSTLNVGAGGQMANTDGANVGGIADGYGGASGQNSNVTGNAYYRYNGSDDTGGNSMMDASAGGLGNSSANTGANLLLNDGNTTRNGSISGSVQATGDETSVRSMSVVSDYGGLQSLSNYQNATSRSSGSSSASASNSGFLKRRKRGLLWLSGVTAAKIASGNSAKTSSSDAVPPTS